MSSYGQTPPLDKWEQLDLKHRKAMIQNDMCPQNSPRGGERFSSPVLFEEEKRQPVIHLPLEAANGGNKTQTCTGSKSRKLKPFLS